MIVRQVEDMRSKKTNFLLICLLIGSFVLSGAPIFVSEDANQDRRIDLKDAVLHAQRVEAGSPGQSPNTCINTLEALAGVKKIASGSLEMDDLGSAGFCFLLPETEVICSAVFLQVIDEVDILFKSTELPLPWEPPILA
jgi:hypothetical protein